MVYLDLKKQTMCVYKKVYERTLTRVSVQSLYVDEWVTQGRQQQYMGDWWCVMRGTDTTNQQTNKQNTHSEPHWKRATSPLPLSSLASPASTHHSTGLHLS